MNQEDLKGSATETPDLQRRNMLKLGALGGVTGLLATSSAGLIPASAEASDTGPEMTEHDEFPVPVADDYQRFHQRNTEFNRFIRQKVPMTLRDKPLDTAGNSRIDLALANGAWDMQREIAGSTTRTGYDAGLTTWRKPAKGEPYDFQSKAEAANAIKRAARLYGAQLVGITRQDDHWDYETLYDGIKDETRTWDDFPFKPRSVIVLGFEMDYEAHAAAPTYVSDGTCGEAYNKMVYTGYQVATFLQNLGYNAVASGNDLGMAIPYGIAAGLGEGSRMGIMVSYNMGPRIRLAKIYTDLEFVEYDKPKTFGVREFCERCMRCADSCPSKAISSAPKPSMYPPEGHDPEAHAVGVEKWYCDTKKCLDYWNESRTSCGACVTACPYNKPDFWQHRMIEKMNSLMPGPLHTFMREMDIWFGFGDTFDPKAVDRFWSDNNRKYDGRG